MTPLIALLEKLDKEATEAPFVISHDELVALKTDTLDGRSKARIAAFTEVVGPEFIAINGKANARLFTELRNRLPEIIEALKGADEAHEVRLRNVQRMDECKKERDDLRAQLADCESMMKEAVEAAIAESRTKITELTTKGESLCCEYGNALIEIHDLRAQLETGDARLAESVRVLNTMLPVIKWMKKLGPETMGYSVAEQVRPAVEAHIDELKSQLAERELEAENERLKGQIGEQVAQLERAHLHETLLRNRIIDLEGPPETYTTGSTEARLDGGK